MQENTPQDGSIEYFKSSIQAESSNTFDPILFGCPKTTKLGLFVIFGLVLGLYFIASIFISNILFVPMTVDGASMYPTLNAEYSTTGNKHAQDVVYLWQTTDVENKDIIVFNSSPYTTGDSEPIYYIKRVIASAGDRLQFVKTNEDTDYTTYSVKLNGQVLNEDYILEAIKLPNNTQKYPIVTSQTEITIPSGYIFVMGDNRNNSKDSREIGLIKTEDVLGKLIIHIPYGKTIIHGIIDSFKKDYIF